MKDDLHAVLCTFVNPVRACDNFFHTCVSTKLVVGMVSHAVNMLLVSLTAATMIVDKLDRSRRFHSQIRPVFKFSSEEH